MIGVSVSVVVGLVFWPRRAEVHAPARRGRRSTARSPRPRAARPRAPAGGTACERRAEAAYKQYLADTANDPDHRRPWDVVLSAADTARNGLRFYEYDVGADDRRDLSAATTRSATATRRSALDWVAIADGDRATTGPPQPGRRLWIVAADSTRAPVVSCLAAHADGSGADVEPTVQHHVHREWVIALTQLTAPVAEAWEHRLRRVTGGGRGCGALVGAAAEQGRREVGDAEVGEATLPLATVAVADDRRRRRDRRPLAVEHRSVRRQRAVDRELPAARSRAHPTSSVTHTGSDAATAARRAARRRPPC